MKVVGWVEVLAAAMKIAAPTAAVELGARGGIVFTSRMPTSPPVPDGGGRSRPARAIIDSWAFQAAIHSVRRRGSVDTPVRLAAFEFAAERGRPGAYRLAGSDVTVVVRHRTRDIEIFDELFAGAPDYEPPVAVRERLARGGLKILDLGGNIGLFGAFALTVYDAASIVSFEPDPHNLPVLHRCVSANAGVDWRVVPACAGIEPGVVHFATGNYADSFVSSVAAQGSIGVEQVDVFPYFRGIDFVKMDIEGSEWPILRDPRLAEGGPDVLVLEWHARGCPTPTPHAEATDALRSAGYEVSGEDAGFEHGVMWAWR